MINTIKINELEETDTISNDDYIIVETQDGTKKIKSTIFNYDDQISNLNSITNEIATKTNFEKIVTLTEDNLDDFWTE